MNYIEYAKAISASEEVLEWCRTTLTSAIRKGKAGDQGEIEHILDYLASDKAPKRLRKMSYKQAAESAEKWSKAQQKKGKHLADIEGEDIRTIHDFLDGTRIVELLTKHAYKREGFFMAHCVGNYSPETSTIYSYRDAENIPHATFEVRRDAESEEIFQIKGKGNGPIHPRYIHPILAFLRAIGMNVRPSDMRNLGYYHLSPWVKELVGQFEFPKEPEILSLFGEEYVYAN